MQVGLFVQKRKSTSIYLPELICFSLTSAAVLCSVFQGLYEHTVKPEEVFKDPDQGSYCTSNYLY